MTCRLAIVILAMLKALADLPMAQEYRKIRDVITGRAETSIAGKSQPRDTLDC